MKKRVSLLVFFGIAVALIGGVSWLLQLRLGQGDVFPAYSTLRADPLGTRALFEALSAMPGLQVERSLKPLEEMPEEPARTIVLAGIDSVGFEFLSNQTANAIEAAARAGSRVVIVFPAVSDGNFTHKLERRRDLEKQQREAEEKAERKKNEGQDKKKTETKITPRNDERSTPARLAKWMPVDWGRRWGVSLRTRQIFDHGKGAVRSPQAPAFLPGAVVWKSDLYLNFSQGSDWRILYTRGFSPVMAEMTLGRGTVVLATDAFFLSNESIQRDRATRLLTWLLGATERVVFMESHLGVEEDIGVARLARRYGLAGAFFTLLLWTAFFVWRRMALFVPPPAENTEVALDYHPSAGLESLLRRAMRRDQLLPTCVSEWSRQARASDLARVRELLAQAGPKTSPADLYNTIVRALRRR